MKILQVHKYFYRKGGDAAVFFDTSELLKGRGHEVAFQAMHHPRNLPTDYAPYFVSFMDLNADGGLFQNVKRAGRFLYSFEARSKMTRLVREHRPDVAHLHSIYHYMSPSIIDALDRNNVPTVMTLHDYKLTCPVYTHLSHGRLCEKCAGGRFYRALVNRCAGRSIGKSALSMVEMYLHRSFRKTYEKINMFLSPSRFLAQKTRELGFEGEIVHVPNFIDATGYGVSSPRHVPHMVYFGRLSPEKGVETLIDAMAKCTSAVSLKIIGEGPSDSLLRTMVRDRGVGNVTFLGYRQGDALLEHVQQAMFVVVPSEWYENNPRAILEAFAMGKPVIGSRIGGIPELVIDGETGYTFTPGDPADLQAKMEMMLRNPQRTAEMGRRARAHVEREYGPEAHYQRLLSIYRMAQEKMLRKRGRLL